MQDPLTPFRVCRINDQCRDPAINIKAMLEAQSDHVNEDGEPMTKFAAYLTTRDERHLILREGMTPTWFVVKRLSAVWVVRNLDAAHAGARVRDERAFRTACHEVLRPDGTRLVPTKEPEGKPACATDEWPETVAGEVGMQTVLEIGRVAHDFATLPKGQSGPFSFPLG